MSGFVEVERESICTFNRKGLDNLPSQDTRISKKKKKERKVSLMAISLLFVYSFYFLMLFLVFFRSSSFLLLIINLKHYSIYPKAEKLIFNDYLVFLVKSYEIM